MHHPPKNAREARTVENDAPGGSERTRTIRPLTRGGVQGGHPGGTVADSPNSAPGFGAANYTASAEFFLGIAREAHYLTCLWAHRSCEAVELGLRGFLRGRPVHLGIRLYA